MNKLFFLAWSTLTTGLEGYLSRIYLTCHLNKREGSVTESHSMPSSIIQTLASVGMAIGAPLVYADQAASIIGKKDSTGFSRDVCAILSLFPRIIAQF